MSPTKTLCSQLKKSNRQGLVRSEVLKDDESIISSRGYYPSGRIQFCFHFKNGKLHGSASTWYENGQLQEKFQFQNGALHGWYMRWFSNGQICWEIPYVNDCYHGRRREWYENGQLKMECQYEENLLQGESWEWYGNGALKERGKYLDGLRQGVWTFYDEKKKNGVKEIYLRGVRNAGKILKLVRSNQLTAKEIVRIQNTALRRICLEEIGYERFLMDLDYQLIDKCGHDELAKVEWHTEEEPLCLVKVRCHSTGAFYTLRVPPQMKTVRQAVAWTFGMTEEQYIPECET